MTHAARVRNPLDSRQLVRTWLYSYSACQSWATNLWSQILDGISGKKFEILEFLKHENFWTLMFESLKSRQSRKLNKHEKSWNLNYAFKWDFFIITSFYKTFYEKLLQNDHIFNIFTNIRLWIISTADDDRSGGN